MPFPFADRQHHRFQRGEIAKKLIDLEGARQAAADADMGRQGGDVLAAEQDLAAARGEGAGEQIDQRGLACTIGSDQGMTRALPDAERDVIGGHEGAEALDQVAGFEGGRHGASSAACVFAFSRPAAPGR
ncbi:hypothetical protein D3C72_1974830 [compost metagenome]